jgi:hypothetical protein
MVILARCAGATQATCAALSITEKGCAMAESRRYLDEEFLIPLVLLEQ